MKSILTVAAVLFLAFFSQSLSAQNAEEVITESSEPVENFYIDDIVPRRLLQENKVMPYSSIREADIAWEKRIWRLIDTREKMNLPFQYPERPFFVILKEAIENGDIKAFKSERFDEMLVGADIEGKLVSFDTVEVTDPETYETKLEVTKSETNPEDIKRYRIKEIWFFDEESSTMQVRIIGMSPIRDIFDGDIFKYEEPLFWVYYKECREVLAKELVFNPENDAAPMTWYDVFESRFFSSYIIKASNVHDLTLKNLYPQGADEEYNIDMLLESEKIKQELFNLESDLWEY